MVKIHIMLIVYMNLRGKRLYTINKTSGCVYQTIPNEIGFVHVSKCSMIITFSYPNIIGENHARSRQ